MRTIFSALVLLVILAARAPAAAPLQFSKAQIEAAYLYNFTRFVEWPGSAFPDASAPLVVGIVGKDPFGSLLDELVTGEKIKGRPIVIRRFAGVQEIGYCHILFIARSETDRCALICAALQNRHVLTVSDIPGFTRQGGMIELVEEQERIRFRIALGRARAELLEISAKLLRSAEVVAQRSREPRRVRPFTTLDVDVETASSLVGAVLPVLVELARWPVRSDFSRPILWR